MHIRHLTIENVRRFGAAGGRVDLDLPPRGWIVVAGRNGAGKTTFLQVLALALSGGLSDDFADTMFSWLREGAEHARTRLTLVPSTADQLTRTGPGDSQKAAGDELVVGDDWRPAPAAMVHGRESDGNRAFAGPWSAESKGWFAAGYGAHRRLMGHATGTERWSEATTREGAFVTLFRDDASLGHPIRWLMDLHHRSLDPHAPKAEQHEAKGIVEGTVALLDDGLFDDITVHGVDSYGLSVRVEGRKRSILTVGAGAQVVTALVVDMLRHMHARFGALRYETADGHPVVAHDGIVLIDEVDAHLHVSWQQRIGPWLTGHFPNVQFIVTTHSPFICQAASPGGLILLPGPRAPGVARIADGELYRRATVGSVDDALLSDLFGLEHTWSERAEQKRSRLATLEAKVLTGNADRPERAEYKRLRTEVPSNLSDDVERAVAGVTGRRAVGPAR